MATNIYNAIIIDLADVQGSNDSWLEIFQIADLITIRLIKIDQIIFYLLEAIPA